MPAGIVFLFLAGKGIAGMEMHLIRVVELEALNVALVKRFFCKGTELKAGCEDVGYPWYHEI